MAFYKSLQVRVINLGASNKSKILPNTARRIIREYEIMNMMRKGQVLEHPLGAVTERVAFINQIFEVVA